MRIAVLIALVVLSGCASSPPLDELEREALATGEWSAVEAREQAIARRNKRLGPECPAGWVSVCFETGLTVECSCLSPRGTRP